MTFKFYTLIYDLLIIRFESVNSLLIKIIYSYIGLLMVRSEFCTLMNFLIGEHEEKVSITQ